MNKDLVNNLLLDVVEPYLETRLFRDANIPEVNRLLYRMVEEMSEAILSSDWFRLKLAEAWELGATDLDEGYTSEWPKNPYEKMEDK